MKRAYKLQEFVAHTSNVNCLKIGRKSAGVLVTGGEDKKVHVWAIGKPTAVLSLSGHQSPVECVSFDSAEEVVVAGAQGGTVKLWDLEQAKVIRTLTGHRSSCLSVDFHPFGNFFASGSLETSLKIWDVRRKACISTYKGHSCGVTNVRFSPDGKLVASGSQDGDLKVWDLTAGKLLHGFEHEDSITGLEFHPSEFLLATSSADRTVKWWDLETSELIDTAGPEVTGVRGIAFPANGDCLLAAMQDGLKVWAYEPVSCLDTVDIPWAKVRDMSLNDADGKLVACSCNNSFVGVWVVDLNKIRPFSGPAIRKAPAACGIGGHSQRPCLMSTSSSTGKSTMVTQQQEHVSPALTAGGVQQDASALSPALIRATKAPLLSSTSHAIVGRPTPAPVAAPLIAYSGGLAQAATDNLEQDAEDWPAQYTQGADQGLPFSLQQALPLSPVTQSSLSHQNRNSRSFSPVLPATPVGSADVALPSMSTPFQQLSVAAEAEAAGEQAGCQVGIISATAEAGHQLPGVSTDHAIQSSSDDAAVRGCALASNSAGGIGSGVQHSASSKSNNSSRATQRSSEFRSRASQLSPESRRRVPELSPEPGGLDIEAFLPPSLSPRPVSQCLLVYYHDHIHS
ncbi:TPA: hypothetical protein ACH3X1_010611 [Trebouxia sp. C0004]